jgi:effector-binding domain-containing protein
MTSPIEIRDMPAQHLLVKKTTCGHKEIGPAFAGAIQSVGECLRASEAKMASPPVAVYLDWRASDCDMAVGCKVEGSVTLSHGGEWLDLSAGPHAVASHFGPYDALQETHEAIRNWCAASARQLAGPCWETYPVDPGAEPDASKWQTDVHYPLRTEPRR